MLFPKRVIPVTHAILFENDNGVSLSVFLIEEGQVVEKVVSGGRIFTYARSRHVKTGKEREALQAVFEAALEWLGASPGVFEDLTDTGWLTRVLEEEGLLDEN